jgi:hypothetical protein
MVVGIWVGKELGRRPTTVTVSDESSAMDSVALSVSAAATTYLN